MRRPKFQIYRSPKNGEWYARFRAANGRIVWQTEGYKRRINAEAACYLIMAACCDGHYEIDYPEPRK